MGIRIDLGMNGKSEISVNRIYNLSKEIRNKKLIFLLLNYPIGNLVGTVIVLKGKEPKPFNQAATG